MGHSIPKFSRNFFSQKNVLRWMRLILWIDTVPQPMVLISMLGLLSNQLIQVDSKALHLDHLNIMKKDQNVVVMLPFLYPSMSIENISHQLMLIVQNTIQNAEHISVLWYNQRPNIIEVVYDANLAPYWIVDDVPMDAKDVLSSRLLDTFSAFSFSLGVERVVKN